MILGNLIKKFRKKEFDEEQGENILNINEDEIPEDIKMLMESIKEESKNRNSHTGIRNQAEQFVFPDIFFNNSKIFLQDIEDRGSEVIYDILSIPYEGIDDEMPYSIEDFKVTKEEITDEKFMTKIELPENHMTMTSCYRIYLIYNNKFEAEEYFTVEKSISENMLCGVNSEYDHLNYGTVKNELEEKEQILSMI